MIYEAYDMSGGPKRATRPLERPLDRRPEGSALARPSTAVHSITSSARTSTA
jgi:hypothetical protein